MVSEAPQSSTGVREGEVVAGKYRIGEVIGAGAMGTVVAAYHLGFEQRVAIKFLMPEALGHSESVARFLAEARAAIRLKSEHVVRLLDVAALENGTPYIVMEHLEGCDLSQWLRKHGALPVEQAVDFILQACDAIAEAHELRIIHRDVKPANLFAVQSSGVVQSIKVLDFGISKTQGLVSHTIGPGERSHGSVITQEKSIMGSPFYMSPEQMESARDVDSRTDIWALGVTLCELATGKLPFQGQSLLQVYSRIASEAPLRLRDSAPHLPPGLEAVLLKCLQRHREKRYKTVGELSAALVEFGSSRAASYAERIERRVKGFVPSSADAVPSAPVTPIALGVATTTLSSGQTRPEKRRFPLSVALGGSALLAAAAAVAIFARGASTKNSASAAVPVFAQPLATLPLASGRPETISPGADAAPELAVSTDVMADVLAIAQTPAANRNSSTTGAPRRVLRPPVPSPVLAGSARLQPAPTPARSVRAEAPAAPAASAAVPASSAEWQPPDIPK